jgi:hypothetical protein
MSTGSRLNASRLGTFLDDGGVEECDKEERGIYQSSFKPEKVDLNFFRFEGALV